MKKLRTLAAFLVICSLMSSVVLASSPSPKIVFGSAVSEETPAGDPDDIERILVEYAEGADDLTGGWLSAIEGFFSINTFAQTAASVPLAEEPESEIRTAFIEDTTFVSLRDFVSLHYPDAAFTYNKGKVTVSHDGFYMEFMEGRIYYYVNGRILPLSRPCYEEDGCFYVPVRNLSYVYSYDVAWNEDAQTATLFENGAVLQSGDEYYDYDDYMLLARLINAESGNQPLEGKIAVGNVVLNRCGDDSFPDTIEGVIYDRRHGIQFTTAYNGALNKKPNEECYVAAKLCLEGYSITDNSLYFFNPGASSKWIQRNRSYETTIGDHVFYS